MTKLWIALPLVFLAVACNGAALLVPTPLPGRSSLPLPPQFDVVEANLTTAFGNGPFNDVALISVDLKGQRYGVAANAASEASLFGDCSLQATGINGEQLVCGKNATLTVNGTVSCGTVQPNRFKSAFGVVTLVAPLVLFQAWRHNITWTASTKRGCFVTQFDAGNGIDGSVACLHRNGLPIFVAVQDNLWINVSMSTSFASPGNSAISLNPVDNC
jgi:hypothetical protein